MSEQVAGRERLAVCSWSLGARDPRGLIARLQEVGLRRVQLALNPLIQEPEVWAATPGLLADAGIVIESGMMGTRGEDYSSLESIRRTGGVLLDEHWEENRRTAERIAELCEAQGIGRVSFHAGFIPHDVADATFDKVSARVLLITELFAERGVDVLLETGQETADSLSRFLDRVDRPNLGVNFDPANMILYGMGDPIAALRSLLPRVRQVHLKDALPASEPGQWGSEVPVGTGAVDWPTFLAVLEEGGYEGALVLEREAGAQRVEDLRAGADFIAGLLGGA